MLGFTSSVPGNFGDNWVSIPQHPWNHDSQSYPSTLLKHLNTPDSALLSKMSFCYFLWHSSLFIPTYVSSQSIAVSFLHLPFLFTPLYLPRFISSIFLLIFSVKKKKNGLQNVMNPKNYIQNFVSVFWKHPINCHISFNNMYCISALTVISPSPH